MANPNPNTTGLKPMKKGERARAGAGRPKGSTNICADIKRCIRALQKDGKLPKSGVGHEMYPIAHQLLAIALSKDVRDSDRLKALDMIMDRVEGKALAKVENTVKQDSELIVNFEEVSKKDQVRKKDDS